MAQNYVLKPEDMTSHQEEVIVQVAQSIATSEDSSRYILKLRDATQHNHHFAFLEPGHHHYEYFSYLLNAYTARVRQYQFSLLLAQQAEQAQRQEQQETASSAYPAAASSSNGQNTTYGGSVAQAAPNASYYSAPPSYYGQPAEYGNAQGQSNDYGYGYDNSRKRQRTPTPPRR
jgi:hypothetical protein